MPVQKIGDVIASSGDLKVLAGHARHLRVLQQHLAVSTPPALAAASRVTSLKAGTLFVLADNAAVAAKLRQLAPRLLLNMQKQGFEVTVLRVEVQVSAPYSGTENEVTKRALPSDAIGNFEKLSEALPASSLKSAVARLVARRRHKPDPG